MVLKVNAPNREEIAALRDGATLVSLISPALNPDLVEQLASRPITALAMDAVPRISRAQSLDVLSSMANIAGYRAVIEAAHRLRPVLHRAGDRGGQGAAGQGAGGRRGCGRTGRHRRGRQPGRHRAGHRSAARGRRPGQIAGRGVSFDRAAGGRGVGHRLRQGDGRRLQGPRGAAVCRAVQGRRHHHHDRADPRQARAADHHRRHGGVDEIRQRDRRHGRGQRRQRRGHRQGSGDPHRQRRDHHRLHRPGRPAARHGIAALRHQPGQPAQAADPGEGRAAHAGLRGRGAALDDGGPRRRDHLAAATGAGFRCAGRRWLRLPSS